MTSPSELYRPPPSIKSQTSSSPYPFPIPHHRHHHQLKMAFAWRNVFTYNRYAGVAARAVRRVLKENKRLEAEKRNSATVRVSKWKDGVQGEQKRLGTDAEQAR